MKTIKELAVGTVVHGINGYSIVNYCVHGNKYYGYIGEYIDNYTNYSTVYTGVDDVVDVIDDDDDSLECCR